MPSRTKIGKKRLDKYYHLAKEQGFRARSAYKLIQINKKFNFLSSCKSIVDLCCAPGSWLQVAREHNIKHVIGVDLVSCKPINGVQTILGDITHESTAREIYNLVHEDVDVVLCDGAPNVGTCWSKDAFEQNALILAAIKITSKILKKNGIFVTKIFRSKDYFNILWVLNQLFDEVSTIKPLASRDNSAEVFLFCKQYKKPSKIDPNFFDLNQIFKEQLVTEDFYQVMKFSDFFKHPDPKTVLEKYTKIILDINGPLFDKVFDSLTKILFDDLKQLSNHDIKKILKKREKLIKFLEKGEYIDGLDLPVREKVESVEIDSTQNNLDNIEHELKLKAKRDKKYQIQKKIRLGKSKIFENLSSIDPFFDDKIFRNPFGNKITDDKLQYHEIDNINNEFDSEQPENGKENGSIIQQSEQVISGNIDSNHSKNIKQPGLKTLKPNKNSTRKASDLDRTRNHEHISSNPLKSDENRIEQSSKSKQFKTTPKKSHFKKDFEEISSAEESFELDSDDKGLLVEMKQDKEAFLERTINKYSLNNISQLPKFYTDEDEVNKLKPTKEEIIFQKRDKKEQEVFNRRVRRAVKFKKQLMEEIKDENDQPKRVFKTCMKKKNQKPKVVVSTKAKPSRKQKGRVLYVDRRMKKDLRKKKTNAK